MKIHNCQQGTEEWLACRLGKLTASVAQTIATAGKGLETLCLEKTAEILTGKMEETFKSDAMIRGNELEAEARAIYELETGKTVNQIGFYEDNEFVGVSPDGLVGEDGLVEIKCFGAKHYTEYLLNGKIDPKYYAQMQMQMLVTNRQWCDYVVYNPDFKNCIQIKRVIPDFEVMDKISNGLIIGCEMIKRNLEKLNDDAKRRSTDVAE